MGKIVLLLRDVFAEAEAISKRKKTVLWLVNFVLDKYMH